MLKDSSSDGNRFKVVGAVLSTRFTSTFNNPALDFLARDDWMADYWRDKVDKRPEGVAAGEKAGSNRGGGRKVERRQSHLAN